MREFTHASIRAHRFTSGRRKGYDTVEVDEYMERVADYVGWMQGELAKHQASERTALDVLLQAQRVADETVASAGREAETLLQNAAEGLENAKKDASATVSAARSEADRTLLSARVQAEAAVEHSRLQVAELEEAGAARLEQVDRLVETLRSSVADCAADFRSAGSRLVEMADHFEFDVPTRVAGIGALDELSIELDEERVEVN